LLNADGFLGGWTIQTEEHSLLRLLGEFLIPSLCLMQIGMLLYPATTVHAAATIHSFTPAGLCKFLAATRQVRPSRLIWRRALSRLT
jgi:hypothetical protein